MHTITISTDDLKSLAVSIKDELLKELKSAGMILSENEAKEYQKFKSLSEVYLKQREVAKLLGVSDQTVMRMKDRGTLKATLVNGRPRYKKSQVLAIKSKLS